MNYFCNSYSWFEILKYTSISVIIFHDPCICAPLLISTCLCSAFILRVYAPHPMRASCVRACVRAWELMGTYENFVRGNLWELMGTYGNLWELMGTYGNFMRHAASCVALFCVVARRFCVMLRFRSAFFALQGVFTLLFHATRRFYAAILRYKAFLRCDFALQGVFTLRFCASRRFIHYDFALPSVFTLCFRYISEPNHTFSEPKHSFSEPQYMFVEPQSVCYPCSDLLYVFSYKIITC